MSWFLDLKWKQRILLILIIVGVVALIFGSRILIGNLKGGKGQEQQNQASAQTEAAIRKVTLSGKDGVTLSQETYFDMGQESGNAYFLAPTGSDAKVSVSLESGKGIGILRVVRGEEPVAFTMEGAVITFKVPDADCTVEATGIDSPGGGGIYGAASEYDIAVFGLTDDLLGLFAGKYNKASLVSALGTAMESTSGNNDVKSLTFTGQEATSESKDGRVCFLALVNANEARRVLVYFDTASGAFSFATTVEADRELGLRNVNREDAALPTVPATPTPLETTAPPTAAPPTATPTTPTPTTEPTAAPTQKAKPTTTPKKSPNKSMDQNSGAGDVKGTVTPTSSQEKNNKAEKAKKDAPTGTTAPRQGGRSDI